MAFGFIGKLVELITGRKAAPQRQKKQEQSGGNGRGKHGKHGRHGKNGGDKKGGDKAKRGAQSAETHPQRAQQRQGDRRRDGQRRDSVDSRRGGRRDDRRNERGGRGDRDRRRGPSLVNTAANEMRPGGVVTPEELARRQAAHASWSIDQFAVPPAEGKKRFHDFDLPSEVMHGIADLGFQYCTEIQSLSLQNALDGKNIAGKAQTGSGKTAAFLVSILTRYLRTPDARASKGGCPRAPLPQGWEIHDVLTF